MIEEFSSRCRGIDIETDRLITAYVRAHGRRPSKTTTIRLRAQATLATRPPKRLRSLADLTVEWRERTDRVLGSDATGWARALTTGPSRPVLRAGDVPLDLIGEVG